MKMLLENRNPWVTRSVTAIIVLLSLELCAFRASAELPIRVGEFTQHVHRAYTSADGLPAEAILEVEIGDGGRLFAKSKSGAVYQFAESRWRVVDRAQVPESLFAAPTWYATLEPLAVTRSAIRSVAKQGREIAVAAREGLFLGDGTDWRLALPSQGDVRWAPMDVRGVTYDPSGQLWFASPQGVGCRVSDREWRLFTRAEGLPFNDFTCLAAGPKGIWLGTTNGAIQYREGRWAFRQGRRWLVANHVHDIVVDSEGKAWIATEGGVSCILDQPMTLAKKGAFFSDEIEKYHRRTRFGYVNPSILSSPGDKRTARPTYSDNDGLNTGLYLAAVCLGYSATQDPQLRTNAENAFRALAFLSEVTQGGRHGAPPGFVARNVIPISEPNPNERYNLEYDLGRNKRDALWKIMQPRLPLDKTGQWYWKCDSSSDELDGHFFGFAVYYDHLCKTEAQKNEVRRLVRNIIEHLLSHDFCLVDYDGKPTRWAHFAPADLNGNVSWVAERGLNSYSILTYLSVAHHITGDQKYRDTYLKLAFEHGYGMNGMSQFKWVPGPRSPGHQPGDNMAFMNYYHLLRYETDPKLLSMFYHAIFEHWKYERLERNPFSNYVYGACCLGKKRRDNRGEFDVSPPPACFEDAAETLKRYPLDLVEWPMSNAHRIDLVRWGDDRHSDIGGGIDGYAYPIDERHETYWDWDPWKLTSSGDGLVLRPGFHYLLAYYLGRFHGFIDN